MRAARQVSTGVAPSIQTQPQSLTLNAGTTAIFSVTASGTAPLNYQWRFNSSNVLAVTGSSLILSNVQPAQAGNYSVLVSNALVRSPARTRFWQSAAARQTARRSSRLVSWWRAEGNGSDSVGSNNALLLNGVGFASGEVGQAFSFDGMMTASWFPMLLRSISAPTRTSRLKHGSGHCLRPRIVILCRSWTSARHPPTHSQGYETCSLEWPDACRLSDHWWIWLAIYSAGSDLRDGNFHHVALTVARSRDWRTPVWPMDKSC